MICERKKPMTATLRDAMYGSAVGDALGVPYEFKLRGYFKCTDMIGHGTHHQDPGTWSDDTAMALALCDSLRENNLRVDKKDIRSRFKDWLRKGRYAIDGRVFDCGLTVSRAIDSGRGCSGERDNGNGSLMRTIPLAFTDASDKDIRNVSAITHAHRLSTESCVCFVHTARELIGGTDIREAISHNIPSGSEFDFLGEVADWPESKVKSGGFVLHTLGAAFWCLANTESYEECVLAAVNLGEDTDTTACVAGGLAGIVYGFDAIPGKWVEALRGKDIIDACLF